MPTMMFSSEQRNPIISANGRDFACALPGWGVLSMPSYSATSRVQIRHWYSPLSLEPFSPPDCQVCLGSSILLSLEIESNVGAFSEDVPADLRRRLLAADELTILELLKIVHEKAGQRP